MAYHQFGRYGTAAMHDAIRFHCQDIYNLLIEMMYFLHRALCHSTAHQDADPRHEAFHGYRCLGHNATFIWRR